MRITFWWTVLAWFLAWFSRNAKFMRTFWKLARKHYHHHIDVGKSIINFRQKYKFWQCLTVQQHQCRLRVLRSFPPSVTFRACFGGTRDSVERTKSHRVTAHARIGFGSTATRHSTVAFQKPLRKVHSENQPLRGEDWRARFYVNNPLGSFFIIILLLGKFQFLKKTDIFVQLLKTWFFRVLLLYHCETVLSWEKVSIIQGGGIEAPSTHAPIEEKRSSANGEGNASVVAVKQFFLLFEGVIVKFILCAISVSIDRTATARVCFFFRGFRRWRKCLRPG